MKAKINKDGILSIFRGNKWKKQYCPFQDNVPCGDWCPLFGTLTIEKNDIYIELCHKTQMIFGFQDERISE